jgi:hypothetical protein
MQPTAERAATAHAAGMPGQREERRLESVVGVGAVVQDPAADAEHERPVTAHQGRKGRLLAPRREALL